MRARCISDCQLWTASGGDKRANIRTAEGKRTLPSALHFANAFLIPSAMLILGDFVLDEENLVLDGEDLVLDEENKDREHGLPARYNCFPVVLSRT